MNTNLEHLAKIVELKVSPFVKSLKYSRENRVQVIVDRLEEVVDLNKFTILKSNRASQHMCYVGHVKYMPLRNIIRIAYRFSYSENSFPRYSYLIIKKK